MAGSRIGFDVEPTGVLDTRYGRKEEEGRNPRIFA